VSWFRRTPLAAASWIAIDCETSGLDAQRDRLLSVGAVPVREGRIHLGGRFGALVRQEAPSASANILVHGIGGDAQLAGAPVEEVMRGLAAAAGDAIPVGFHAPFDEAVLRRHGFRARKRWLDLAVLAPALFRRNRGLTALEEWLGAFGMAVEARHDALGDAFSTAQLLLVVLDEAKRQRVSTVEELRAVERGGRWL
jgi:DNA polymerase-3 subunit epsilon